MTLSVAMTTQLRYHSTSAMACNACHASEFFILHTSANFEKSNTPIYSKLIFFLKSINFMFYMQTTSIGKGTETETFPGVLGNMGTRAFILGEQRLVGCVEA